VTTSCFSGTFVVFMDSILYLRYSTPEQAEGQSEKRQIEYAKKWSKENGAELVRIYKDLGISGGKKAGTKINERKGLAELLADLRRGEIPKFLLVEDVDRLSRMLPLDSLKLIEEILALGVSLVSTRDGQILTKENWQQSQSFLILTLKTTLASEERAKRIYRGKFNWKQKRLEASKKIYTRRVSGWLKVENDKIVTIPECVVTVRKMFKLANDGYGIISIIRRFNEQKEPSFYGNDWNKAIIHNTLTSEAVLGWFQPKTNIDGKRVEDGDKIPNYFPRIIDDELFYAVQAKLKQRNKYRGAGFRYTRKPGQNNLFAGLIKCAKCGASLIHLVRSRHGYSYLVCGNAHKHKKCEYRTVSTNILEECFQVFLKSPIFTRAYQKPTNTADATKSQIESTNKQLAKYFSLIDGAEGLPPKSILKRIQDLELRLTELEQTLKRNLAEDSRAATGPEAFEQFCKNIDEDLKTPEGRVRVASLLKDFIDRIVVDPKKCTMTIFWAFNDVDTLKWSKKLREFWHLDSLGCEDMSQPLYTLWSVAEKKARTRKPVAD
jgi:DNA invertase Pin-like site-specific DNA recombinase